MIVICFNPRLFTAIFSQRSHALNLFTDQWRPLAAANTAEEVTKSDKCIIDIIAASVLSPLLFKPSSYSRILAHTKVVDHVSLIDFLLPFEVLPGLRVYLHHSSSTLKSDLDSPNVESLFLCVKANLTNEPRERLVNFQLSLCATPVEGAG